jgi:hypothetical protein
MDMLTWCMWATSPAGDAWFAEQARRILNPPTDPFDTPGLYRRSADGRWECIASGSWDVVGERFRMISDSMTPVHLPGT